MSMVKNSPKGPGRRVTLMGCSQIKNAKTGRCVKRDSKTRRFMDQKSDGGAFKGVTKER